MSAEPLALEPAGEGALLAGAGARRRRSRLPVSVGLSAVILLVVVAWALVPGAIAPEDPAIIQPAFGNLTPSADHLLGTDQLGRDMLSRVIHGARSALVGPLIIASLTVVISVLLALVAGYRGGWTDAVVGRTVDVLYALPPLLVAIIAVGVLGGGYWLAIGLLTVLGVPTYVRILRAAVIEQRHLAYIEAAETLGVRPASIMLRHLLPNLTAVIATSFFLRFTYGIVDLSALSFLGLGTPPGAADWGRMVAENRAFVVQNPWAAIGPGVALMLVALSGNFIGDWVYERFQMRARAR